MKDNTKREGWPSKREDYDLGKVIGISSTAVVHEALCKTLNFQCAIKRIRLENESKAICERSEIQTITGYNHKNVIKYFTLFTVKEELWIVMSLLEKGSLLDIIKHKTATECCRDGVFDEAAIATVMRKVLKGLVYLHKKGQIHRDIKAENILLSEDGNAQISGFGLNAWQETVEDVSKNYSTGSTIERKYWVAPEEIGKTNGYSFKADIWSFGITVIEMATGTSPYETCITIKDVTLKILTDPVTIETVCDKSRFYKYGKEIKEMIATCLQKRPQTRPTAAELLKHPFFKKANKSKYLVQNVLPFGPSKELRSRIIKDGKKSPKLCGWVYQSETKEWIWSFGEPEPLINYLSSNFDEEQVLAGMSTCNSSSFQENRFHADKSSTIDDLIGLNYPFFSQTSFQLDNTSSGNQESSKTKNIVTNINDPLRVSENAAHKAQLIVSKPVEQLKILGYNDNIISKGKVINASRSPIEKHLLFDTGFGFDDTRSSVVPNCALEKDIFPVTSVSYQEGTDTDLITSGRGIKPLVINASTTNKTNVSSVSNIFDKKDPFDATSFLDFKRIDTIKETTYGKENYTSVFSAFPSEERNASNVPNISEEINLFGNIGFTNDDGIDMNSFSSDRMQSVYRDRAMVSNETKDASIFNTTEEKDPFGLAVVNFVDNCTIANRCEKETFPFSVGASTSIKTNVSSNPNITDEKDLFDISALSKSEGIHPNTNYSEKENKYFIFSTFASDGKDGLHIPNINNEIHLLETNGFTCNNEIDVNPSTSDKMEDVFGINAITSYETKDSSISNINKAKDMFSFDSCSFNYEIDKNVSTSEKGMNLFDVSDYTSDKISLLSAPKISDRKDLFGGDTFTHSRATAVQTTTTKKGKNSFAFTALNPVETDISNNPSANKGQDLFEISSSSYPNEAGMSVCSDRIKNPFLFNDFASVQPKQSSITDKKDLSKTNPFNFIEEMDVQTSNSNLSKTPFDFGSF